MTSRPLALALAAVLGGCQLVAAPPRDLQPLDLTLTRRCPDPSAIPQRDLTEREVATLWGRDRLALTDCGRRFAATVKTYENRDRRLSGGE
jgi:hypothetical protein